MALTEPQRLERCLKDPDLLVRIAAVRALYNAYERLLSFLAKPEDDEEVRRKQLNAVRQWEAKIDKHTEDLVILISGIGLSLGGDDEDGVAYQFVPSEVRRQALSVMGQYVIILQCQTGDIITKLDDPNEQVQSEALDALGEYENVIRRSTIAAVSQLHFGDPWRVRKEALRVLDRYFTVFRRHTRHIIAKLEDSSARRWSSRHRLSDLGWDRSDKQVTRKALHRVLGQYFETLSRNAEDVVMMLKHSNAKVRTEALRVLGRHEMVLSRHTKHVIVKLRDPDQRVQQAALRVLRSYLQPREASESDKSEAESDNSEAGDPAQPGDPTQPGNPDTVFSESDYSESIYSIFSESVYSDSEYDDSEFDSDVGHFSD